MFRASFHLVFSQTLPLAGDEPGHGAEEYICMRKWKLIAALWMHSHRHSKSSTSEFFFSFLRTRHAAPKQSIPAYHLISGKSWPWHLHCKQQKCISISPGAKQSRTFQTNYMKDVAVKEAMASRRIYTPNKSNKQI